MEVFVTALAGVIIGLFLSNTYWMQKYDRLVNMVEESGSASSTELMLIEKHNNTYIAYDEDSNFIAQEPSLEDLVNSLIKKYKAVALGSDDPEIRTEIADLSKRF